MTPGTELPPCWWVSPKAGAPAELLDPRRGSRTSQSPETLPGAPGILHSLVDFSRARRAPQSPSLRPAESLQLGRAALALSAGEELYSGVAADLMGRDFTIFRSLGQRPSLRTEPHDSRWLNGERLVGLGAVLLSRAGAE